MISQLWVAHHPDTGVGGRVTQAGVRGQQEGAGCRDISGAKTGGGSGWQAAWWWCCLQWAAWAFPTMSWERVTAPACTGRASMGCARRTLPWNMATGDFMSNFEPLDHWLSGTLGSKGPMGTLGILLLIWLWQVFLRGRLHRVTL